tara:strand:+ start:274 stop:453 length:180 start_codon:yes stop_codon:yes gene_type:complete
MDNIYLGPEFSPNEIDSAIREYELQRKYKIVKELNKRELNTDKDYSMELLNKDLTGTDN